MAENMNSNITIIDPATGQEQSDRNANGQFNDSHRGPGRPKGAVNMTTRAIREAITGALNDVSGGDGGRMYFTIMAATRPELFIPLVAKTLPIRLAGDDEDGELVVTRIERVIIDPQLAKK
jgi:hypothetical protein